MAGGSQNITFLFGGGLSAQKGYFWLSFREEGWRECGKSMTAIFCFSDIFLYIIEHCLLGGRRCIMSKDKSKNSQWNYFVIIVIHTMMFRLNQVKLKLEYNACVSELTQHNTLQNSGEKRRNLPLLICNSDWTWAAKLFLHRRYNEPSSGVLQKLWHLCGKNLN